METENFYCKICGKPHLTGECMENKKRDEKSAKPERAKFWLSSGSPEKLFAPDNILRAATVIKQGEKQNRFVAFFVDPDTKSIHLGGDGRAGEFYATLAVDETGRLKGMGADRGFINKSGKAEPAAIPPDYLTELNKNIQKYNQKG